MDCFVSLSDLKGRNKRTAPPPPPPPQWMADSLIGRTKFIYGIVDQVLPSSVVSTTVSDGKMHTLSRSSISSKKLCTDPFSGIL